MMLSQWCYAGHGVGYTPWCYHYFEVGVGLGYQHSFWSCARHRALVRDGVRLDSAMWAQQCGPYAKYGSMMAISKFVHSIIKSEAQQTDSTCLLAHMRKKLQKFGRKTMLMEGVLTRTAGDICCFSICDKILNAQNHTAIYGPDWSPPQTRIAWLPPIPFVLSAWKQIPKFFRRWLLMCHISSPGLPKLFCPSLQCTVFAYYITCTVYVYTVHVYIYIHTYMIPHACFGADIIQNCLV